MSDLAVNKTSGLWNGAFDRISQKVFDLAKDPSVSPEKISKAAQILAGKSDVVDAVYSPDVSGVQASASAAKLLNRQLPDGMAQQPIGNLPVQYLNQIGKKISSLLGASGITTVREFLATSNAALKDALVTNPAGGVSQAIPEFGRPQMGAVSAQIGLDTIVGIRDGLKAELAQLNPVGDRWQKFVSENAAQTTPVAAEDKTTALQVASDQVALSAAAKASVKETYKLIRQELKTAQSALAKTETAIDKILFKGQKRINPKPRHQSTFTAQEKSELAQLRETQKELTTQIETVSVLGESVAIMRGSKGGDGASFAMQVPVGWGIPGIVYVGGSAFGLMEPRSDVTGTHKVHGTGSICIDVLSTATLIVDLKQVGKWIGNGFRGDKGFGVSFKLAGFYSGYNPVLQAHVAGISITGVGWLGVYWNKETLGFEGGTVIVPFVPAPAFGHPKIKQFVDKGIDAVAKTKFGKAIKWTADKVGEQIDRVQAHFAELKSQRARHKQIKKRIAAKNAKRDAKLAQQQTGIYDAALNGAKA